MSAMPSFVGRLSGIHASIASRTDSSPAGKTDNSVPVNVAVVGAGLAGLSAAIFLQKRGVDVVLFDRHHTLAGQGVETTVGVLFQECFRASGIDLTADLEFIGAPIASYVVRDGTGAVTSRERIDATKQAFGRRSYDVSRPELMRLLLNKFVEMGGVFRGGCTLESVRLVDEHVAEIHFDEGLVIRTPSLIAADGIHSKVRRQLFDTTEPEYPGVSLVYGILPGQAGLIKDELESFQMMLADEFSVLTSHYLGEKPETWFAVLSRSEKPLLNRLIWAEGKSDAEAGALKLLSSSAFLKGAFLNEKPPRFIYSGGLQTREMSSSFAWSKGPCLLIGDAVHGEPQ